MDKSKQVPKSVLDILARAVVSTATQVLPALGDLILQGASRDQTLEALDHALAVGRRVTTHELIMKRTRLRKASEQRAEEAVAVAPEPDSIVSEPEPEEPVQTEPEPEPEADVKRGVWPGTWPGKVPE